MGTREMAEIYEQILRIFNEEISVKAAEFKMVGHAEGCAQLHDLAQNFLFQYLAVEYENASTVPAEMIKIHQSVLDVIPPDGVDLDMSKDQLKSAAVTVLKEQLAKIILVTNDTSKTTTDFMSRKKEYLARRKIYEGWLADIETKGSEHVRAELVSIRGKIRLDTMRLGEMCGTATEAAILKLGEQQG